MLRALRPSPRQALRDTTVSSIQLSKRRRNRAQLESLGEGRFRVSGVLDATTVTQILADSTARFEAVPDVVINFAGVTESDSSGLALLLEWLRRVRKTGHRIHFDAVPTQILALARISEVDDLLLENGSTVGAAASPIEAPASA